MGFEGEIAHIVKMPERNPKQYREKGAHDTDSH